MAVVSTHRRILAELDALLAQVLLDAFGEDEQLWALRQAFADRLTMPVEGEIVGLPVLVVGIDYEGHERRGLTARCRREDGSEHVASLADVRFHHGTDAAKLGAVYRRWLGLDPLRAEADAVLPRSGPHEVSTGVRRTLTSSSEFTSKVPVGKPVELIVLMAKERSARCRIVGTAEVVLVRAGRLEAVPGQIIRLTPRKQWRQASRVHLSGDIEFTKTSASDLGISPLSLHERGVWQPSDYASLDARQPLEHWQRAMVARGPRPAFEMEQVIPGYDERLRPSVDPILHAAELFNSGDARGARSCLGTLLEADLRCLDAHAHLGSFAFEYLPQEALRHYEVGLRIGELSLYDGFDGLLPSCFPDNRPFLRCLHGHGLTLWRLGRFDEAERALSRLLWLDPIDDQGVSALLPVLRSKVTWQEYRSLR